MKDLDLNRRQVVVSETDADFFTQPRGEDTVEILKNLKRRGSPEVSWCFGEVKATERVTGYVTKESDSEVIVAAMRKVAAHGVYISEKVAELLARERMPKNDDLPHTLLSDREFQVFDNGDRLV